MSAVKKFYGGATSSDTMLQTLDITGDVFCLVVFILGLEKTPEDKSDQNV